MYFTSYNTSSRLHISIYEIWHNCLPSWDKSFFCSRSISDWDMSWSLAWFSLWIRMLSAELSGPPRPRPDSRLGPVNAVGSAAPHWSVSMQVSGGRFCSLRSGVWAAAGAQCKGVLPSFSLWAANSRAKRLFFPAADDSGTWSQGWMNFKKIKLNDIHCYGTMRVWTQSLNSRSS